MGQTAIKNNTNPQIYLDLPNYNAETIAAINESKQIIKDAKSKNRHGFTDMNSLLRELNA
jgi:hypothetical protein